MEIHNAVIEDVSLNSADHGCLTVWVTLQYDVGSQGFGGFALYLPKSYKNYKLESLAGHFIWRLMEVAGVSEWGRLKGKCVRVRSDDSKVEAVGHIIKDDWFCPSDEFKEVK